MTTDSDLTQEIPKSSSENAPAEAQEYPFQAEVGRLLDLLAHSLYQSKEIAVRELISNAADALDKRRHLGLMDESLRAADELCIRLEVDTSAGRLTISDNGVGMTREELAENLGSIARSGSRAFLEQSAAAGKSDLSLIGRFGVGFYSAFMLADRVEVSSKSCHAGSEEGGWCWESTGAGTYAIRSATEHRDVGTTVMLYLKSEMKEEFTRTDSLRKIVRQYSGFTPHPILLESERVNDVRPIWLEPKNQISDEQYVGFYKHLTHEVGGEPLWRLHLSSDSPIQFHAILFCPPQNHELLGFPRIDHGVNLCAKRVLVQQECRELLPEYLRFLVGVVDCEDLPLNISRETLQDNELLRKIRRVLVRKSLDTLLDVAKKPEEYRLFYEQYASILKEGFHEERDSEIRTRLAKLLRFASTHSASADAWVGLDEYLTRASADQKRIYYLCGPNLEAAKKSPHLEVFRKRGCEVLLLADPIDDYVLTLIGEYEGKRLTSVDSAELDLPAATQENEAEAKTEPPTPGFERVLSLIRQAVEGQVKDVRESVRLTDSACCLVNADGTSAQMQKLIRLSQERSPTAGASQSFDRVLEINPRSPFIRRLATLSINPDNDGLVRDCGRQLLDNARLLEGVLPDPQGMVERIQRLMETAADKSSSIIV